MWCPGLGVVLDCIDSWSLPSSLLWWWFWQGFPPLALRAVLVPKSYELTLLCLALSSTAILLTWGYMPYLTSISFLCPLLFRCHFTLCRLGRTWFSCSLYFIHSEQAEQKSSALGHLCWCTPEYSIFPGGEDKTCSKTRWRSTAYIHCTEIFSVQDMVISKKIESTCILSFFILLLGNRSTLFFTIQTIIAWFTPEYSKVPRFVCFRSLFWRTPRTLKLFYRGRPW